VGVEQGVGVEVRRAAGNRVQGPVEVDLGFAAAQGALGDFDALGSVAAGGFDGVPADEPGLNGLRFPVVRGGLDRQQLDGKLGCLEASGDAGCDKRAVPGSVEKIHLPTQGDGQCGCP